MHNGIQTVECRKDTGTYEMFLPEHYITDQDAAKINEGLAKTLRIMTEKPLTTNV